MMQGNDIAIIGIACRFPDADDPEQFWENILAGRRAFRDMPSCRMNESYFSKDSFDHAYARKAAVLKNFHFDRNAFKVSKATYETADIAHWLALDTADRALKNAGLHSMSTSLKENTGVIVGNTLTGDYSRSNAMRLRWPYVAAAVALTMKEQNYSENEISSLINFLEQNFKKPFPCMEEDSLAGGLSNTIAGRICNYFDLKGGGFTIDGACSSSLLAVIKACEAIANKDLSVAVVGGVDLSLDPFELVGFSRAGALAKHHMLVYDRDSNGFWPGEGCGFVVLADLAFAKEQGLNILAVIKGWGISSDGSGGLTRPEKEGQMLAMRRAYDRARYSAGSVSYIEGHGTGTQTGDMVELSSIRQTITEQTGEQPVYIGSAKANIGHTKAAAGIAGLIKAIKVLQTRTIPAASGVIEPHPFFHSQQVLQLPTQHLFYNDSKIFRAGVNSMGFGGINTHVTLEEYRTAEGAPPIVNKIPFSYRDTELFLLAAPDKASLKKQLHALVPRVKEMSYAEMTDLSCTLHSRLEPQACRVAIEAATPEELEKKISLLLEIIQTKESFIGDSGIYYSCVQKSTCIGLLCPGQGNGVFSYDGWLLKEFPFLDEAIPCFLKKDLQKDLIHTHTAQPAIVATTIAAIKVLQEMGIQASVALGHSVGEIGALYFAGVLSEEDAIQLATRRGRLMHDSPQVKGGMISISLGADDPQLRQLIQTTGLSPACINTPVRTVLSGATASIAQACRICEQKGIAFAQLKVENAFHSRQMSELENEFRELLQDVRLKNPNREVFSTVSGLAIQNRQDAISNLCNQLAAPVQFYPCFSNAEHRASLWIEAGVGTTLSRLVKDFSDSPVISLDLSGKTFAGLARVTGALFVLGYPVRVDRLFANRFYRIWSADETPVFIKNPCESLEVFSPESTLEKHRQPALTPSAALQTRELSIDGAFRKALGEKLGLAPGSFSSSDRMLNDFHLNSLFVGQFLSEFALAHHLRMTDVPLEYSNASIEEIVHMFGLLNGEPGAKEDRSAEELKKLFEPEGIDSWIQSFATRLVAAPLSRKRPLNREAAQIFLGNIPPQVLPAIALTGREAEMLLVFNYAAEPEVISNLLEVVKLVSGNPQLQSILILQERPLCNAFAKSLFRERPGLKITVITIASEQVNPSLLEDEMGALDGFNEVTYETGHRLMPELELCVKNGKAILPSVDDVVLVTGGAKGITLECVRYLGMLCGCRFILLGRNNAENDALLANNLSSLSENRIHFEYFACDISDGKAVNELVATLRRKNRTITGMIHGAGVNVPKRTEDLRLEDIENTLRPKLYGLQNLMGSMELSTLKFCISFGSIIGALGMEGNGDYALANQWLENRMLDLARQHLNIYFLNIQWSVWGGTGMGQSLGVLERLKSKGIEPITLENGIRFLEGIFKHPPVANSIIATGRYGRFSLRGYCQPPGAGHYRFIQQVAVHYPQIELITECDLSSGIDLYLKDHAIDGNLMLPGVFSLEAIAQAAATLTGMEPSAVCMEDIEFLDPIIVKPHVSKKLRVIIQRIGVDRYSAVIREDSREFKKDAIRCKLHWGEQEPLIEVERPTGAVSSFEPSADLYDSVLFHKGVFERVKSYFSIEAYACMALATRDKTANYFSDFMPKNMLLGDPALNDSVLHALQVCVPDRILLPLAVHRLRFHTTRLLDEVIIRAKEVKQEGAEFVYDIRVTDQEGNLVQEWTGVRFHALHRKLPLELPARLAQVMLQRKTDALLGTRHQSFIKLDKDKSWEKTTKRTDGKPSANGYSLSRSYSGNVALSISSEHDIVCDAEMVIHQSDARWCTLLGEAHMQLVSNIQRETGEGRLLAATRVWCAVECIRKAGLQDSSPLLLERSEPDGTVYMHSAGHKVMTYNCSIKNEPVSSMFAVLIRN